MNAQTDTVVPPAGNISECLTRMAIDGAEIERRLLGAPASLTGGQEPKLYEILQRIKKDLKEASEIWRE